VADITLSWCGLQVPTSTDGHDHDREEDTARGFGAALRRKCKQITSGLKSLTKRRTPPATAFPSAVPYPPANMPEPTPEVTAIATHAVRARDDDPTI
jgi:hypothetical protein